MGATEIPMQVDRGVGGGMNESPLPQVAEKGVAERAIAVGGAIAECLEQALGGIDLFSRDEDVDVDILAARYVAVERNRQHCTLEHGKAQPLLRERGRHPTEFLGSSQGASAMQPLKALEFGSYRRRHMRPRQGAETADELWANPVIFCQIDQCWKIYAGAQQLHSLRQIRLGPRNQTKQLELDTAVWKPGRNGHPCSKRREGNSANPTLTQRGSARSLLAGPFPAVRSARIADCHGHVAKRSPLHEHRRHIDRLSLRFGGKIGIAGREDIHRLIALIAFDGKY